MTILYSFFTEIIIVFSLVYFLILGLGLKPWWNHLTYPQVLFNQLVLVLGLIFLALCVTEGHWHFVLQAQVPEEVFYPTTLLSSTLLSFVTKVVLLVLTMACVLLHKPVVRGKAAMEYCILILFITLASFLLISSADLAFAFVAMELQTLSLITFSFIGHSKKKDSSEASFRYFVNTSFASVCFLFSLSLFYALTGTVQLDRIVALLETEVLTSVNSFFILLMVAAVLLFFAFFFKLTLAPFHHWVGDLYQGTSGYVGSYFTLVTKLPLWLLLTKIFVLFLVPAFQYLLWTFQVLAVVSLVIGNVYAFSETNFRRFWAMASVGHMGQLLLALTFFGAESVLVASFYLILYLSANLIFWGLLLHQQAKPNFNLPYVDFFLVVFRFFSLTNKKYAFLITLVLISLAGVPPAFGFAAKFYLFFSLYQAQNFFLLAVVFFSNLISLSYYLRLIRLMYFKNSCSPISLEEKPLAPFSRGVLWAFTLIFLVHCFFGFWLLQVVFSAFVALI